MKQNILDYYKDPSLENKNQLSQALCPYIRDQAIFYVHSYGLSSVYVDDVVQETIIRLLPYIDHSNLINRTTFINSHKGLIQAIVRTQVLNYVRKFKTRSITLNEEVIDKVADTWESEHAEISDLINQLDPPERFLFRMKLKGNSDQEIADMIGYKRSSITKRLKKVRKKMKGYFYDNELR
jgi:RNA polymerase sigma factor (sigma-70 family)